MCNTTCVFLVFCVAGLGTESTSCGIVSGEDNKGDGIVMCGSDPEQVLKDKGWNTTQYKVGSQQQSLQQHVAPMRWQGDSMGTE